jgi:hypothetical protein
MKLEEIKSLLSNGYGINQKDSSGSRLIHLAKDIESLRFLSLIHI